MASPEWINQFRMNERTIASIARDPGLAYAINEICESFNVANCDECNKITNAKHLIANGGICDRCVMKGEKK